MRVNGAKSCSFFYSNSANSGGGGMKTGQGPSVKGERVHVNGGFSGVRGFVRYRCSPWRRALVWGPLANRRKVWSSHGGVRPERNPGGLALPETFHL